MVSVHSHVAFFPFGVSVRLAFSGQQNYEPVSEYMTTAWYLLHASAGCMTLPSVRDNDHSHPRAMTPVPARNPTPTMASRLQSHLRLYQSYPPIHLVRIDRSFHTRSVHRCIAPTTSPLAGHSFQHGYKPLLPHAT